MKTITVYHGTTKAVEHPLCRLGRPHLDFGQGFYLTDIREQARMWADRMSRNRGEQALLNVYSLEKGLLLAEAHSLIFPAYDREWLQFIVANRRGEDAAAGYDYIEGGVADDRVINAINMYMQGYYSEEYTLRLLALHRPNNQICLRNQELTDKFLHYAHTEPA